MRHDDPGSTTLPSAHRIHVRDEEHLTRLGGLLGNVAHQTDHRVTSPLSTDSPVEGRVRPSISGYGRPPMHRLVDGWLHGCAGGQSACCQANTLSASRPNTFGAITVSILAKTAGVVVPHGAVLCGLATLLVMPFCCLARWAMPPWRYDCACGWGG